MEEAKLDRREGLRQSRKADKINKGLCVVEGKLRIKGRVSRVIKCWSRGERPH